MLFGNNEERAGERVLYKTKPNMFLGCKKAIFGVVLLVIIFMVSSIVIKFIGKMQVYLISRIQMPLTEYAAIGFFVLILVVILYIVWQLLKWYSLEYTLTDTRIIIKSGLLSSKKNYMPYRTIQDIDTSQSVLARLFNVGTVSAYSAYDNNQIKLENISDPSKVEDIIFSNMMGYRNFQEPPRNYINRGPDNRGYSQNYNQNEFMDDRGYSRNYNQNEFMDDGDYYDEYEPITPINRERYSYQPREYEYYPEEFSFQEPRSNKYEYEPYEEDFERTMDRAMENPNDRIFEESPNEFSNDSYYNEVRQNYSRRDEENYQNYEPRTYYDEGEDNFNQNVPEHVEETKDSGETAIRRHFDKFKK